MFPFFFFNFIQSLPTGKPNLVTPSLAKLDVDALRRDIPRFQQNMPKEAADAWEGWFNRLDGLTCVPETYNWPVEVLNDPLEQNQLLLLPKSLQTCWSCVKRRHSKHRRLVYYPRSFKCLEQLKVVTFSSSCNLFSSVTGKQTGLQSLHVVIAVQVETL